MSKLRAVPVLTVRYTNGTHSTEFEVQKLIAKKELGRLNEYLKSSLEDFWVYVDTDRMPGRNRTPEECLAYYLLTGGGRNE